MEQILVNNIRDLSFRIFLIGYPDKGESIVLIISDKSLKVNYYSIVIDCYETTLNKTLEILNDNNIKSIDLLCWSHPDEDHTKGLLDIIQQKCSHSTTFLLPEGLYGKHTDVINYTVDDLKIFDKINSFNTGTNYKLKSGSSDKTVSKLYFKDNSNNLKLLFEATSLSPNSSIIRRRIEKEPANVIKNDFSIALLINFGELNFLLSSDIGNQAITQISDDYFEDICFVKTPHHSSKYSDKLLSKLKDADILIGCTTVFTSNLLPDPNIVNEYKKKCLTFHSTGTNNVNNSHFGVIEYCFDITDKSVTNITLIGNAIEL